MFADNTLTPKEVVRLCALGTLAVADGPMRYSELANAVRHFISRVSGPSLEIMGTSIELLRYEGLVEAVRGSGMEDDAELALSDSGRAALHTLMTAPLRASAGDVNRLITTLKMRFLHLLDAEAQCQQAETLIETCETELARLEDLRRHHDGEAGNLINWLDHEIGQMEGKQAWLEARRKELCAKG